MNQATITLVTSNAAKARSIAHYLQYPVEVIDCDLDEIQSLDLKSIARKKIIQAYKLTKTDLLLVEDTSLQVEALGGLPGSLIKWFLLSIQNEGMVQMIPSTATRKARAEVMFALLHKNKIHYFSASINGTIANEPRGKEHFGWESIFVPDGYTKTWAEMDTEEQKTTSIRRIALEKLNRYLQTQFTPTLSVS